MKSWLQLGFLQSRLKGRWHSCAACGRTSAGCARARLQAEKNIPRWLHARLCPAPAARAQQASVRTGLHSRRAAACRASACGGGGRARSCSWWAGGCRRSGRCRTAHGPPCGGTAPACAPARPCAPRARAPCRTAPCRGRRAPQRAPALAPPRARPLRLTRPARPWPLRRR